MRVSVVIPNWNGEKLLRKNLPKVIESGVGSWELGVRGRKESLVIEIIVVDDGSKDKSIEYLKTIVLNSEPRTQNPELKIIENKKNRGFIYSCNRGVKEAKGEIIVLLNNDVVPEKGFLEHALPHFKDPKVFAVSFHEPDWSWARIEWQKGFVQHFSGPKTNVAHISAWASGGSAAFRKSIWQELGGFDPLYAPFYWEDIDLSYRAWKRGYKVLWEPKAVVYHKHEGTISRFSKNYVRMISERNQLLFIWKNIASSKMMFEHHLWLGKKLLTTFGYWKPFLAAVVKIPQILPRRFKEIREKKIGDSGVLAKFR